MARLLPGIIHNQESVLVCVFLFNVVTMGVLTCVDVCLVAGGVNVDIGDIVAGARLGPRPGPGPGLGTGLFGLYNAVFTLINSLYSALLLLQLQLKDRVVNREVQSRPLLSYQPRMRPECILLPLWNWALNEYVIGVLVPLVRSFQLLYRRGGKRT